jgi:hypothetical protein
LTSLKIVKRIGISPLPHEASDVDTLGSGLQRREGTDFLAHINNILKEKIRSSALMMIPNLI